MDEETPSPSESYVDEISGPAMLQVTSDIDLKSESKAKAEPGIQPLIECSILAEPESSPNSKRSREILTKQINTEAGTYDRTCKLPDSSKIASKNPKRPRKKKTNNSSNILSEEIQNITQTQSEAFVEKKICTKGGCIKVEELSKNTTRQKKMKTEPDQKEKTELAEGIAEQEKKHLPIIKGNTLIEQKKEFQNSN
eukprot:GHVP01003829.1.p1 GENE.GHVP01003829.1~~GHVP01003829.1.p1  ORF type:complete len:196 (-),score=41.34 GHVP01003829.1:136-723(-)